MSDAIADTEEWNREETAVHMAEQICLGFKQHDRRKREGAIEAFATVDALQFPHIDRETARYSSVAYVDALWAKDRVEEACLSAGEIDEEALAAADWEPVEAKFRERASIVGIDPRYAEHSTVAWRNHKSGEDYWTPLKEAIMYEIRAAIQDPKHPRKPRYGQSGHGPLAARYVLAVELHDMHTERHWQQARDVMVPYFDTILREHD